MNPIICQSILLAVPAGELLRWLRQEAEVRAVPDTYPVEEMPHSFALQTAADHTPIRFLFTPAAGDHTLVHGEAAGPFVPFFLEWWERMQEAFAARPGQSRGYGPNMSTLAKLERLHTLRRQSIFQDRVTLSWTAACRKVGIDPKTVRQHDPALRAHWDDPGYR